MHDYVGTANKEYGKHSKSRKEKNLKDVER